jgi:hypothetical protein
MFLQPLMSNFPIFETFDTYSLHEKKTYLLAVRNYSIFIST